MFSFRKSILGGVLLAIVASFVVGAGTASAALPVKYNFPAAAANSLLTGATSPAGANDWKCKPSAAHPRPIVLVHGTILNQKNDWSAVSPELKNAGYCVYSLNYGAGLFTLGQFYGLAKVTDAASELKTFINKVKSSAGTSQVDIVAHSLGGVVSRYYIQKLSGASSVKNLVSIASPHNGTTMSGIAGLADIVPGVANVFVFSWCKSCADQIVGSSLLASLNAGGGTSPSVSYTNIVTKYDEIVTPYDKAAFLSGSNVSNITLQNGCDKDYSEHLAITYDQRALWYVRKALDPSLAGSAPCVPVVPLVGG